MNPPRYVIDTVRVLASPPQPSQLFPTRSSPVSHTHYPFLCTSLRMAYNFLDYELTLSQAMEAFMNGEETPISSRTSQSLRVLSTKSPSHQPPLRPEKLRFLGLDEWDERNTYDEEVPTCLHYSIEWKVICRDTEQDLVLAPTAYWHESLKHRSSSSHRSVYLSAL